MTIALVIVGSLLCLALTISAMGKLRGIPQVVASLTHVGLTPPQIRLLGFVMLAGVAGVIVGIWVPILGTLASLGLVLYFAGAVIAHVRVKDGMRDIAPSLGLGLVSLLLFVLELMR